MRWPKKKMVWSPRYFTTKAPGIDGPSIPPDEPLFVIRAHDVLAPVMVLIYIRRYGALPAHDPRVTEELFDHFQEINLWQTTHEIRVADR